MESRKHLILNTAILVAILSSATADATNRPPITCHVALFQTSQSASLVCRYNKDLSARRENYAIVFCSPDSQCLDAISCNWDGTGQALYCVTADDFQGVTCTLSGEQTGDLVCQLPNVGPQHSGSYTCQLIPPDERVQQSCAVVVPGEDEKDEEKSESAHVWALTVVVIVLGVAVIAAFIVFVVRITRKKMKRSEDKITQPSGSASSAHTDNGQRPQCLDWGSRTQYARVPDNDPNMKTPDTTDQRASASSVSTDKRQRQDTPVRHGSSATYMIITDKEEIKSMIADVNRSMRSDQGLTHSEYVTHSGSFSSKKVSETDPENLSLLTCDQEDESNQNILSSPPVNKEQRRRQKGQADADYSDITQDETSTSRIGHYSS